jgi:hypothetical protein
MSVMRLFRPSKLAIQAEMTPYHAPNAGTVPLSRRATVGQAERRGRIVASAGDGAPRDRVRLRSTDASRRRSGTTGPPTPAHPTDRAAGNRRPDRPRRVVDRIGRCRRGRAGGPGDQAGFVRGPSVSSAACTEVGAASSPACSRSRPRRALGVRRLARDHGDERPARRPRAPPCGSPGTGRPGARTQPVLPQRDADVPRDAARGPPRS